jgi:ABC-type multidrug transport system permease subunit
MTMKLTKILQDILIIAWMKSYPDLRRNPLTLLLIGSVGAIPLFFMAIFGGGNNLIHGIIGATVSSITFIGIMAPIQDIPWDRYVKMRETIVAMPVHPVSYAMGVALAPLLLSIPSTIFFGGLAAYLGALNPANVTWMILTLVVAWASMSTMGFVVSTYLFKVSNVVLNTLSNLLGFGFVFIPPVFYSEAMLGNLSWISVIIPTSNAAGLIRAYLGLLPLSSEMIAVRWLILMVTTVVFVAVTSRKSRWREN